MARIAGINIPDQKHSVIALTAIYGIGKTRSKAILAEAAQFSPTQTFDLLILEAMQHGFSREGFLSIAKHLVRRLGSRLLCISRNGGGFSGVWPDRINCRCA